jgi:hypothetical protein
LTAFINRITEAAFQPPIAGNEWGIGHLVQHIALGFGVIIQHTQAGKIILGRTHVQFLNDPVLVRQQDLRVFSFARAA